MQRRDFIVKSGLVVTATALSGLTKGNNVFVSAKTSGEENQHRDDHKIFSQPIMQALAIALNAPTAHNTQPFKFKIKSDYEAALFVDPTRLLPATDPPSRQIHMSCGCFIELLYIGVSIIGYEAQIDLFPQGNYQHSDIGLKPVANITLTKTQNSVHALAQHAFQRFSSRLPYSGNFVSAQAFEAMQKEANSVSSMLIFQNDPAQLKPFLQFFKDAMRVESYTHTTNEETRKMWRFTDEEMLSYRNGLTWEAQGMHGIGKFFAKKFVKNTEASWNDAKNIEKGLEAFSKGVDSSKGIVYWITETNTFSDWIKCGRDIMRFWLVLTKNNLYAHPLNQVIQEYPEMDKLRTNLDALLNIKAGQKIQMIMRIGKSDAPFVSYRKHLKDFITHS
jgi:hypothetical protein